MKDALGREINYMRISVTDRCNLRCAYCMPEEGVASVPHDEILRFSEILRVVETAADLGIRRLKITGGEPLVRRGIVSLIRDCRNIPGIEEVTLTTNGILLGGMYEELTEAGLGAVTISLDTLDREAYRALTRRDELPRVLQSLQIALEARKIPVKINCVSCRREDPEEFCRIAELARDHPVHVRFIEMMPIGLGRDFGTISRKELIEILRPMTGTLTPVDERLGNGPASYYKAEGYQGRIGFISAVSHKFCDGCNRVRLTSDGFLKSCLQYETGADLKYVLRNGDDNALQEAMIQAIWNKPVSHSFGTAGRIPGEEHRKMSGIGG